MDFKVIKKSEFWRSANFLNCLFLQNALNSQRVAALVKTAETMGILDTYSDGAKQADIDEILGFLASLEKVTLKMIWKTTKHIILICFTFLLSNSILFNKH